MKTCLLLVTFLLSQAGTRSDYGTVSGQVLSPDGTAVAGLRLTAVPVDDSTTRASLAQTDSTGRYRLENIPPGRYFVTLGSLESPTYYPGVKTPEAARVIAVIAGGAVTAVDFALALAQTVRISGRILNAAGAPSGLLKAALNSGRGVSPLTTDLKDDGTFEFTNVSPGTYTVALSPINLGGSAITARESDVSGIEFSTLPLLFGNVRVEGGGRLPPEVVRAISALPTAAVRFHLTGESAAFGNRGMVRDDGAFVIPVPQRGEYRIRVTALPVGYYFKSMSFRGADLLLQPIKVEDVNRDPIDVVLTTTPPAGTPSGVSVSGRLAEGVRNTPVWLLLQGVVPTQQIGRMIAYSIDTPIKPDGTFEFMGVPPGNYTLMNPNIGRVQNVTVVNQDVSGIVFGR